MKKKLSYLLLLLLPFFSCAHTGTAERGSENEPDMLSAIVGFYQGPLDHLSAVRRGECSMHPSCSAYAKLAAERHGPLVGWIMACDRLVRCGRDETERSPKVFVYGKWKFHDPVEKNDFWMDNREASDGKSDGEPESGF